MTTMKAYGHLLTASVSDRVLTYRLLPYGEEGRTNVGKITASKGHLRLLPPEQLVANLEHEPTRPVARFVSVTESDAGLDATVRVLATSAGNDLLVEAAEGVRTGISVEIEDPVIRAGALVGGTLTGAGFVTTPAFPSAQLVAADAGELPADATTEATELLTKALEVITTNTTPEDQPEGDNADASAESETEMGASLTAAAAATAGVQTPHGSTEKYRSAEEVYRLLASAFKSGGQPKLLAALTDITHDDGDNDGDGLGEIAAAPEWLGEVWANTPYTRKWIPLVANAPLTSYRQKGFHFGTKPLVQKYSGNKAAIPSNGMTATPVDYLTDRWAHGADLDRRYIDFGDSDVIRAFVEAQVESYRKETDLDTHDGYFDLAATFTPGTVPSGIDAGLAALIDGALTLVGNDLNPTFAIIGVDLYRPLLFTLKDKGLEFLSMALGLEEGSLAGFKIRYSGRPSAAGKVLVGDGSTVVFKEFGGGTPVRVEAEHVANGGRDLAVFGYTSLQDRTPSTVNGVVVADLVP